MVYVCLFVCLFQKYSVEFPWAFEVVWSIQGNCNHSRGPLWRRHFSMWLHDKWRCIFWTSAASLILFFLFAHLRGFSAALAIVDKNGICYFCNTERFSLWLTSQVFHLSSRATAVDLVLRRPPFPGTSNYGMDDSGAFYANRPWSSLYIFGAFFFLEGSSEDSWRFWQAFHPLHRAISIGNNACI